MTSNFKLVIKRKHCFHRRGKGSHQGKRRDDPGQRSIRGTFYEVDQLNVSKEWSTNKPYHAGSMDLVMVAS